MAQRYAAFISYAREDEAFARQLETQIEAQTGPTGGAALQIFRDRHDFTGSEYHRALEGHLRDSASMIVVCSPSARQSQFVGDEIRRFAALSGAERIFPVLLAGLPDNEADDLKAFPPALLEVMGGMPLAADYRNFDPRRQRLNDADYEAEWFKLLGNIEGVPPAQIRQRDERTRLRAMRRRILLASAAVLAMAALLVWVVTLWQAAGAAQEYAEQQRAEAERQRARADEALRWLASTNPAAQTELAQLARREAPAVAVPHEPMPPMRPQQPESVAPPAAGVTAPEMERVRTSATAASARIYLHIRDERQRSAAERLAIAIRAPDRDMPGIERLDVGPARSELRYFRSSDKAEAEELAAQLRADGVAVETKLVAGYEDSRRISPRQFEVWLAPGEPGS
jgi:hypothetical protein